MTNENIQAKVDFFAESDWESQRIIYREAIQALADLAADRDEARRDLEWGMKKWRATIEEERMARLAAERRAKEALA